MAQLVLGMVTASVLQLILPFLTQGLVDTGIRDNNLGFITLILYIAIGDLYRQAIRGLHTELDIAARKHEDQYRLDLRFPRQADAPAPAFLRYQDGGRYHAAHRRP